LFVFGPQFQLLPRNLLSWRDLLPYLDAAICDISVVIVRRTAPRTNGFAVSEDMASDVRKGRLTKSQERTPVSKTF
jgi:hypothetical protein